ncbi:MAG: SMP-30/gluconolactonase/LRE family protein [Solirubrobacteraceae bacterium]
MQRIAIDHPYRLRAVGPEREQLGEGPIWDDRGGRLLRVDILGGRVLASMPPYQRSATMAVRGEVSAAVLCEADGIVLAIGHELVGYGSDGSHETLAIVEAGKPENRFNDCRCDPQGRLWAGTMNKQRRFGRAALYCLTAGEPIRRVIAETTLSNGIGWSPGGELMYFVDSTTQGIDVFDFDGTTGMIENRRRFATVDPGGGLPDGLTVDAAGGVWLCLFGGAAIHRYAPDGSLNDVIQLPVTNPTCPAFGGPDLETLFITSARHRLSQTQLDKEPLAGAVLALEPGVAGLPANRFAGWSGPRPVSRPVTA